MGLVMFIMAHMERYSDTEQQQAGFVRGLLPVLETWKHCWLQQQQLPVGRVEHLGIAAAFVSLPALPFQL